METIEFKKSNIISLISSLNDEMAIDELDRFVQKLYYSMFFTDIVKPMKKDISVDEMMIEQNFKPLDRVYFDSIVKAIDDDFVGLTV